MIVALVSRQFLSTKLLSIHRIPYVLYYAMRPKPLWSRISFLKRLCLSISISFKITGWWTENYCKKGGSKSFQNPLLGCLWSIWMAEKKNLPRGHIYRKKIEVFFLWFSKVFASFRAFFKQFFAKDTSSYLSDFRIFAHIQNFLSILLVSKNSEIWSILDMDFERILSHLF